MISRRTFIVGASLAFPLCSFDKRSPDSPLPLSLGGAGDAHVHLFNAADLPVAGYVNYTVVRLLPDWAENIGFAIVDILAEVIKPVAVTARKEREILAGRQKDTTIDTATFGARIAAREDQVNNSSNSSLKLNTKEAQLSLGYSELRKLLAQGRKSQALADPSTLERARIFEQAANEALSDTITIAAPGSTNAKSFGASNVDGVMQTLLRLFRWSVLMMQRRTLHLDRFLDNFHDATAPMDIVNLLVDYDLWLDDQPSSCSDAPDQWEVWHDIAKIYQKRVNIRTFAGYCPLRHAIETANGGATRFDAILAAHKEGKIAGLKLYPPMGFYPSGNMLLPDSRYVASDGAKGRGLANWQKAAPGQAMGPALEARLDATYKWATDHKVPILAHAGQRNHAGREFEDRAHPKGWLPVVRNHPQLRLCLGHFSFTIDDFIAAMESNPPDRNRGGWPLQGTEKMIADGRAGRSNVFVDISHIEEILPRADQSRAYKFFCALKKYIAIYDPDCSQLMYGSDWIMLEREAENADYLKRVSALMQATDWPLSWQANVLRNNLQRFLTH